MERLRIVPYNRSKKRSWEMRILRRNGKLACGALAVSLISGILGLVYLITLGVRESELTEAAGTGAVAPLSLLLTLGIIMIVSTLVMILALPKKK